MAWLDPDDIILFGEISIYLSNLLEEEGEFRIAVQVLRTALNKITEERERMIQTNINFKDNSCTPKYLTVDNMKISEMQDKIDQRYWVWKRLVLRRERDR